MRALVVLAAAAILLTIVPPSPAASLLCPTNTFATTSYQSSTAFQDPLCREQHGGGGGTYQTTWNDQTYNETRDPLARFTRYSVSGADSRGVVNLTPHAYRARVAPAAGSLSHLTNADISAAMQALDVTPTTMAAEVELLFDGRENFTQTRARAIAHIQAGDFLAAKVDLEQTFAAASYWCGPTDAPSERPWVLIVPAILDCSVGGVTHNVPVTTHLTKPPSAPAGLRGTDIPPAGAPSRPPAIDPYFFVREIELRTVVAPVANGPIAVVGAAYGGATWMGRTQLDKTWALTANMTQVDSHQSESGFLLAEAIGDEFSRLDRFAISETIDPYWGDTFEVTLDAFVQAANMTYAFQSADVYGLNSLAHADPSVVRETMTILRLRENHQWQMALANQTDGVSVEHEESVILNRTKHTIGFGSVTQSPFRDSELKATYFVGSTPRLDLQLMGLPGDEDTPDETIPDANQLRLDFGSPAEPSFSFDLTKHVGVGHYRTVIVTARETGFPFVATASQVARLRYGGGVYDPWTMQAQPFVEHDANLAQREGNSTLASSSAFSTSILSRWDADINGTSVPTAQRHAYSVNGTCEVGCAMWVPKREWNASLSGATNVRFWSIGDRVPSEEAHQLALDVCRPTLPGGGCF